MTMDTEDKKPKDPLEISFNSYVGAESGFLKGICFGEDKPLLKELTDYTEGVKPVAIKTLCWKDQNERKELLVGHVDRTVKVYNTKLRAFTDETRLLEGRDDKDNDSPLAALSCISESNYLVGLEDGTVSVWNYKESNVSLEYKTGDHLSCVRPCALDPSLFATGGKENDLKIWKLGDNSVPIFKAKNVPHVYELRQPVWVQDATFLPQATDIVAVATRHGQLRLYDAKVGNKNRPVINMEFCDHPVMSIAPTRNDRQVIVGSSQGKVGLVDLRNYGKERLVHLFLGFNGSVRSIVTDENTPYFVSCGLDRYLYLHNLNEKRPVKKLYLKSRLTSVAITKNFLSELVSSSGGSIESSWQNIDNTVLPGPVQVGSKHKAPSVHSIDSGTTTPTKKVKKIKP